MRDPHLYCVVWLQGYYFCGIPLFHPICEAQQEQARDLESLPVNLPRRKGAESLLHMPRTTPTALLPPSSPFSSSLQLHAASA